MQTAASAWVDLGDGITVRQSRVFWMNTVVLSERDRALIVDPGVLPSELDDLAKRTAGASEVTLVFTHGDWDHVLGRPWWPGAATIAHDRLAAEVRAGAKTIAAEARRHAEEAGERWEKGFEPFRPSQAVSGLRFTKVGGWRLVFRDAPGHSASMLSMHVPERGLLVAGDMLSDLEIPILHQPVATCRRTLEELLPLARGGAIETLVPGHGGIARSAAEVEQRIRADLDYLERLEAAAGEARGAGLDTDAAVRRLAAMPGIERKPGYSMAEYHAANARIAFADAGER